MDVRREVRVGFPVPLRTTPMKAAFCASTKHIQVLASVPVTGSLEIKGLEDAHIKQEEAELGCSLSGSWARLGSILSSYPDSSI